MNKRVKIILDFWFIEASPEEKFNRNDEFDNKIKDPFFEVKNFIIKARTFFQDIEVTAVNLSGITDNSDCMKVADDLEISFRSQEYVHTN